ncbi:MAG: glycosyltransferase family 2 protein [Lachnospiraceae bacterium]|nr:glycosyltransferase family 2 protein [Lachnospiraceae bacterium]
MRILVILTCYNRKEKTKKCIETITDGNPICEFSFVVADDGSNDGTLELLRQMNSKYQIYIVKGNGNWFYSGGMNAGMKYALQSLSHDYDYMLMINDDVEFSVESIQNMINQSVVQRNAVIVGAMRDDTGHLSYGAIKYTSGYKYRKLDISEWKTEADTFNANCVLIPYQDFEQNGPIDSYYRHSLGDFDYGISLQKSGCKIFQSREFVGICNNNSKNNTWADLSIGRIERIRKKENIKGAPIKQWFYFLKKNFGLRWAIKGAITPYIRIIFGK